jgi:16S rRNA (guanine527-N7)-methyltransferase
MSSLYDLLIDYNRKVNLTRIQSEEDYWIKHVADSLSIARYFPELGKQNLELADIGCGAGFPSLVLSAAFPSLKITAIDSIGKKTAFVESAGVSLQLGNLQVITGRSKELNRKIEFTERFDVVTARAVSDLRTLVREAKRFVKPEGRFIFFKTPEQADSELPLIIKDTAKNGLKWQSTEVFTLPGDSGKRLFVYSS